MFTEIKRITFSLLLCVVLLAGFASPTHAQTAAPAGLITLADLGKSEIRLTGPYDSTTLTFGLPATWQVSSDAQVTLNTTTAFNTVDLQNTQSASGGTLTVSFNRKTIGVILLDQVQTKEYMFNIPAASMVSPRLDGLMELSFQLDSSLSCFVNQNTIVLINSVSSISFSYTEVPADTSLASFPRPLYQRSIYPDFAYIVVPDQPTSAELQGALSVAAGLGSLTSGELSLDLLRVSDMAADQKASSHLIFVGKASSFSQLGELSLPSPADQGQFKLTDPDAGIVQMVASPSNKSKVVLLVSGNTDAGVIKAAQAISTGNLAPYTSSNLSVVNEVRSVATASPLLSDQTLADMGFGPKQFQSRGISSSLYSFTVPSGTTVTSDAFFDLAYGHSTLVNYDLSGLVVLLNGQPIGSVRFTEETSKQSINTTSLALPPALIVPGKNVLEVRANLEPLDNCVDPNLRGLWAVIWPQSRLHLPFDPTSPSNLDFAAGLDLGNYPAPMVFDPNLTDTAFIFSREEPETWRSGLQIASFLGNRAKTPLPQLRVFFDDETESTDLSSHHLIVVGRPSTLNVIGRMAQAMPVPFEKNADVANDQFSQVVYQLPQDSSVGYLELFQSPWNTEKVVIAALGNNPTGEAWAASSLFDVNLRSQLAGNFAVLNNTHIQTMDTRLAVPVITTPGASDQLSVQSTTPLSQIDVTPQANRPAWILPALFIAALFSLILIGAVATLNWRRTH